MKRITLFAMGLVISLTAHAQGVETSIGADIVSSYIWRGQDLGSTAIQPTLGIEYKGLSFSISSQLPSVNISIAFKNMNSGCFFSYSLMSFG